MTWSTCATGTYLCSRSEFTEPQGWYHFLLDKHDADVPEEDGVPLVLPAVDVFVLQVCILGNHLNGKDTHIRGMKVFGPPAPGTQAAPRPPPQAAPMERLVQQGMRTDAFQRQVARVGYERAIAQLQRIMQQHAAGSSQRMPARAPARRSALTNSLR